jgi:hypothetical protein
MSHEHDHLGPAVVGDRNRVPIEVDPGDLGSQSSQFGIGSRIVESRQRSAAHLDGGRLAHIGTAVVGTTSGENHRQDQEDGDAADHDR